MVLTAAVTRLGLLPGERAVFRSVNDLPDVLLTVLWPMMQAGAFAAVPVAAGAAAVARRWRLSAHLLVAGLAAYEAALAVKILVGRDRPAAFVTDLVVRGAPATGLGYPSGHATVAAALAGAAGPFLSRWSRRAAWVVAGAVSFARVYVGAHFPADVVGGLLLGWTVASAVRVVWPLAAGRTERSSVDP